MIHICIPCRDEDRTIGVLLWKIREVMLDLGRDFQILVLDDGSRDGTGALLEKYRRVLPLKVLTERRPIGYGRALEKLLRAAAGGTRYPRRDAIVTMQADFTEHPEHLRALIRTFEGGADIVACETGPGSGKVPLAVRFARWLGVRARRRPSADDPAVDPLVAFRAYRAVVVRKALQTAGTRPLVTTDGWSANAELMRLLTPFARRVALVPLGLRYDIRWRRTRVRVVPAVREMLRAGPARLSRLAAPAIASGLFAATPFTVAAQVRGEPFLDSPIVFPRGIAEVPFGPGEDLKYKVKYGAFGVGEARMSVAGIDTLRGHPVYAAALHIKASPLWYDIDHTLSSWIDTETLVSRRFVNDQRARERYREYEIFPEERRVQRIDHDTAWAIPTSEPLDDIAFVYLARTLPLEVGQTYEYNRYFKEERNPIILKVLRKDKREVGAGVFNTIVVQPLIPGSSFFSEGGEAEIHLSDDERRLLVYMKVDGPVIPLNITMHLQEIQPGVPLKTGAGEGENGGEDVGSTASAAANPSRLRVRGDSGLRSGRPSRPVVIPVLR